MHYYELFFDATEELLKDWFAYDDDELLQTFYCKVEEPFANLDEAREHLLKTFPPTEERHDDLIDCLFPSAVEHLRRFEEVSPQEFEDGCGIPA